MASETIADIVREIRECMPQKMEGFKNGELVVLDTAKLADRIEAAHEREVVPNRNKLGNNAKMREVCEVISYVILPPKTSDENGWLKWLRSMQGKAREALAEPPRNCDRYPTFAAAIEAWRDIDPRVAGSFNEWLFAEAEGGAE